MATNLSNTYIQPETRCKFSTPTFSISIFFCFHKDYDTSNMKKIPSQSSPKCLEAHDIQNAQRKTDEQCVFMSVCCRLPFIFFFYYFLASQYTQKKYKNGKPSNSEGRRLQAWKTAKVRTPKLHTKCNRLREFGRNGERGGRRS